MNNEFANTNITISVKSLISIFAFIFIIVGEYIVLHKEIEDAKELPVSEVSSIELKYNTEKLQYQIEALERRIDALKK